MMLHPNFTCSSFQQYCEKSLKNLTQECIDAFSNAKDEGTRIKLLYEASMHIPVAENNGKSFEEAEQLKKQGNDFFMAKKYESALETYNKGIIKCPQSSEDGRILLTILISNRSATYFEQKEYKRVFNDIDYLIEIGSYPQHLEYKIWVRKARCYDALQNERLADELYSQAIKSLKHSQLDDKAIAAKIKEIETTRKRKIEAAPRQPVVPIPNPDIFIGGNEYIAAHPKITIEENSTMGRYAVANDNIIVGTIIVEENPHCAVVDTCNTFKNCQYCFISVDQPIACSQCGYVVFCSTNCERQANKSYHKIECPIMLSLVQSGASVNCLLALRIVSQRHYSYFIDKKNKLKEYLNDDCTKKVIKKKTYRFDDYDNVFFLCRNQDMNKTNEMIRYTVMACFLLRLLKFGHYFPSQSVDGVLTDEEMYIGSLILRHLQLLRFNAHEISELRNLEKPINIRGLLTPYENATIGAGLYPTLALFNHSCDPSIVRYNFKSRIIVRTIKPVKAGDIIYENYGPLYMAMPAKERHEILKNNYCFECTCLACTEDWPMFDDLNEKELRIACSNKNCPYVFKVHEDDDLNLHCEYCNRMTPILRNLQGLMALHDILPEAETFFEMKEYDKALPKFLSGLDILYKYMRPPHAEIVKVQQRIRVCMIHMGNTASNYLMLNQRNT